MIDEAAIDLRITGLENVITILIKRIADLEDRVSGLNVRTSGLQMIGLSAYKYEGDPDIMSLNLSSFERS